MNFKDQIRYYFFYTFLFFSILGLGACKSSKDKNVKEPEGLIKKEAMVSILVDMHLLEGADALNLPVAKGISSSQEKIFLKYGTNRVHFISSLNYYKSNLDQLQEIYDKVTEELTTVQTTIISKP